jgi:hypothetical protein
MPERRAMLHTFCRTRPERQRPASIKANGPCFERKNSGVNNDTGAVFIIKPLAAETAALPAKPPTNNMQH